MIIQKVDRIGSWTAVFIGLPVGLAFCITILVISLFPMLDIGIAVIGGGLFWHPVISFVLLPLFFAYLLWMGGKRIKQYFDKKYSTLKASYQFTLFINVRLFTLILVIFILGGLFFRPSGMYSFSAFIAITAIVVTTFIFATAITTFTIGLLIVSIAKKKIYKALLIE